MGKILKKPLWIVLTILFLLLFVTIMIGGSIANNFKRTINNYFQLDNFRTETVPTEDGEKVDSEYFKSNYVQTEEDGTVKTVEEDGYTHQLYDDVTLWSDDVERAHQVQREGTTILWNNGGLPIAEKSKVSLFSHSSVDFVYSGWGSGEASTSGAPNMLTALGNAGLTVNYTLWQFYKTGEGKNYPRTESSKVNEVPWDKYTDAVKKSFATHGDAAIVVLSRRTGEEPFTDAFMTGADTITGDYFELSAEEKTMIENLIALKKDGTFKKIVVLLNTAVGLNFDILASYKDIDSCLWVGQPGTEGLTEIGNILSGRSIPGGHLVDTFLYDNKAAPASVNVEYSTYTNAGQMGLKNEAFQGRYTTYSENIYVGYKYFETRYEDAVLGVGNASSTAGTRNSKDGWVYAEEVAFPFGHGGSYTEFTYSDLKVAKNDDGDYDVTLTVQNTGKGVGADAVQVYIQKPYTAHDKEHGLEQAAVNLCGYAKTAELEPGGKANVKITVRDDAFKTYDDAAKNTYIFEKGDYYITAAQDAHDAVNNILAAKGKTPANTNNVMDAAGNAELVKIVNNPADDYTKFAKSDKTEQTITNQFAEADWNKYSNKTEGDITYLSRSDWSATYPKRERLSLNAAMVSELTWNKEVTADPTDKMPLYGQSKVFDLIDLRGYDFDHEAWDTLLDQLKLDEQIELMKAMHGTPGLLSINKPSEIVNDGPLGVRRNYQTNSKKVCMSFPLSCLLAASYNDALSYEVGRLMGEDMLHTGCHGIYAPTANLHRSAYGGRTYEYYSEDGFLTGMMAKYQIRGMQELGCIVNMKHFALNDQESQRKGVNTWANEQSIREVYLMAFQYSVEEEDLKVMMDAFNRLGTTWCGAHEGLLENVLRKEWGFSGYVISDCPWEEYMGVVDALMAGQDCILYEQFDTTELMKAKSNPTIAQALRQATHRILYITVNSNAMNGYKAGTRIIELTHWWQNAILACQIVLGILLGASAVLLALCFVGPWKKNKKGNADNA